MKCQKCGSDNREGVQFCEECGAKLELECPACKAKLPLGKKFCGECGHALKEPTETPAIDYSKPQSYTPKFLADKILTKRSVLEGERKLVTVLFADVANYTAMSEKLDPEEIHQIMDGCFRILMNEIHNYEGTVNQFTGDGVMALFGAPIAHEDHAQRACYAALSIQKSIKEYEDKIQKGTGLEFKLRIGLNSGPVIVGSIGDDLRLDYTAVGDTTNLASRMESIAQPGSVLVTKNIYKLTKDFFQFEPLGKVDVKGKEKPQEAYKLIQPSEIKTRIGASVAKGLIRFVGRKNSMAALNDPYEKVQLGSGQVVGIIGEAGVGKSRLLLEFVNQLPQGEFTYFEGRCLHYGSSIIYMPILDILRHFFDIDEGDREFIIKKKIQEKTLLLDVKPENTLPSFQELLSLKVDNEDYQKLKPKQKRDRTFEAIRDLLIRISHEKPLVIAFEDLHWIDKTTEEFIDYLIGSLANSRILLILLYRPEYTHQWGSQSYYNKVSVNQLGTESSTELVKAILEGGEIVPEIRDLILKRSDGNPFFMEEFTHSLIENGTIRKKDYEYVLDRKVSEIRLPDTLQGIIAARMDRLEKNLKHTMQIASVIGRDFAFRILQTITGMKEELKSFLLTLQGLEFIYEKNLFPELEYIFKHALTQEVAYNSLLLNKRREVHERIAKAIEDLYPYRLEEFHEMLAYHYSKSEHLEKSYKYLRLSGMKAADSYANQDAFRLFKETLEILNLQPQTAETKRNKIEIQRLLCNILLFLGYPQDSLQILQEGDQLANELGDRKSIAIFNLHLANIYNNKGDTLLAVKHAENSIAEAEKVSDIDVMVQMTSLLVMAYNITGNSKKVVAVAEKLIDIIEENNRKDDMFGLPLNPYSFACAYCGAHSGYLGNFKKHKTYGEKGLQHAVKTGDPIGIGFNEMVYGHYYLGKGNFSKTVEHLLTSIKYAEKINWPFALSHFSCHLGYTYSLMGEKENAIQNLEKGLKIQTDLGILSMLSTLYAYSSMAYYTLNRFKHARKFAEKAIELSQKHNEIRIEGLSKIYLGAILAKSEQNQNEQAENYIFEGIKILEELEQMPTYSQGYFFLGKLYLERGRKEKALSNLHKAENIFKEMGMDYWLYKTQKVLKKLRNYNADAHIV